jgi:hypothetical protein
LRALLAKTDKQALTYAGAASSDYVAMRGMTFATDYSKSPLLARP